MSTLIEGAGVALAVVERGAGRPVLLIHDLAADAAALDDVAETLAGEARVIAYDRRGYGASGAPEPYEATTVHEQGEDAAAVLRATAGAPAVVAGDGFGALIALDLLTRHSDLVAAAVLRDPPLFAFVPDATEMLSAERLLIENALREGGPALAVERWLGADADPERRARARVVHRAFFADVAGLATWPVTRATLRAIAAPVVVQTSCEAPAHVVAAAAAVADLLPDAQATRGDDLAAAVRVLLADA